MMSMAARFGGDERRRQGQVEEGLIHVYARRDRTHWIDPMRTNIDIDETLLAEAMAASGKRTKKETVHEALELLVRVRSKQTAIRSLRGKIDWEGDLDALRRG
jgi:Arc/MetJ family transcription regulator